MRFGEFFMDPTNIYQGALMEHNMYPSYKKPLQNPTCKHHGINPNCGDDLTIFLEIKDGKIANASFEGSGCAISQASADMMCQDIIGKSIDQTIDLSRAFRDLIQGKEISQHMIDELDEAYELKNISTMPPRVKCALLAWNTLDHLLDTTNNQ